MRGRSGQALIFTAILMLLFVAFAALVVDGARGYFAARETQGAADAAAIGGTLALIENGSSSDAVAGAQLAGNYPAAGYPAATLNVVNSQPDHAVQRSPRHPEFPYQQPRSSMADGIASPPQRNRSVADRWFRDPRYSSNPRELLFVLFGHL